MHGFAARRPSAAREADTIRAHTLAHTVTDELGGRAPFQLVSEMGTMAYALRNEPVQEMDALAQKWRRCPSMGWSRVAWQAVLRACGLHSRWTRSRPLRSVQPFIRVPRAHRCSPLSTFVVCAPRVIAVGCCCCSGARIDERARPDAAVRCSTPAGITWSAWDHRALRKIDALLRFRRAVVAPRWLRWLHHALLASQASRSRGFCVGRGSGAKGRGLQCVGRLRRAIGTTVARYSGLIALVRKNER